MGGAAHARNSNTKTDKRALGCHGGEKAKTKKTHTNTITKKDKAQHTHSNCHVHNYDFSIHYQHTNTSLQNNIPHPKCTTKKTMIGWVVTSWRGWEFSSYKVEVFGGTKIDLFELTDFGSRVK